MRFAATPIDGLFEVFIEPAEDARGFFARTWCAEEFARRGLPSRFVQASVSRNREKGTLRGLHFQWPPSREGKLVRCERGAVHDVVVDLRPESPSYLQHFAVCLGQERANAIFIPPGVAHGFQTLEDDTQVFYMMTDVHAPALADGFRWDDPAFGIDWPLQVTIMSERDRAYPDFDAAAHARRFLGEQS